MRNTKLVLEMLTEKYPPGKGQHHSVTLADSDNPLTITLFMGDVYQSIELEEYDLDITPAEVVRECERVVEENKHHYKELQTA